MMSLTKGANAPLNELHLTFTLDTPEPVDLAALLVDSNAEARGDQDSYSQAPRPAKGCR